MSPRVVYIGGLGRSGSTLIERALGSMDGVCAVGELVHLWHRGVELNETCGCGERFLACPFWTAVGDAAFGGWDELDLRRVEQLRHNIDRSRFIPQIAARGWRPRLAADVYAYVEFYDRLYRGIGAVSGASTIIDSSKHPSLAFMLATSASIDLRVVQVVRDPRAVAHSWTKTIKRPEATESVEDEMYTYSPARAAALWTIHNTSLRLMRGTPRLELRFEDFVASPRETVRRIADWAGIPGEVAVPITADGIAELAVAHTVSGNPVRHSTGPVQIAPQPDAVTALSTSDRTRVTALALPLLRHYRYPLRSGSPDPRPTSTES